MFANSVLSISHHLLAHACGHCDPTSQMLSCHCLFLVSHSWPAHFLPPQISGTSLPKAVMFGWQFLELQIQVPGPSYPSKVKHEQHPGTTTQTTGNKLYNELSHYFKEEIFYDVGDKTLAYVTKRCGGCPAHGSIQH